MCGIVTISNVRSYIKIIMFETIMKDMTVRKYYSG